MNPSARSNPGLLIPLAALAMVALVATACNEQPVDPIISSETHWLQACDSDAVCGPYACVCNVCTFACTADDACTSLGGASCHLVGVGPVGELCRDDVAEGICLPSCEAGACDPSGTAARSLTCEQAICLPEDALTRARAGREVDVLFVVDNSGSMCEEQAQLRENVDLFIRNLADGGVDFHLAVVTTDLVDPNQRGRFQNTPSREVGPACSVVVDVSACPTENGQEAPPKVIASSDPRYRAAGVLNIEAVRRDFGCNATAGTSGTGFEAGLEAARLALSDDLRQSDNAGFLRDDALLAVVFLTDENDCSHDGGFDESNGNNCEWHADQLTPTSEYIDFFGNIKGGDDARVVMTGIIAPDEGARWGVGEEIMPTCSSPLGEGYAGWRYEEVINAFEDRRPENICTDNFSDGFSQIAAVILDAL